MINTFSAAPSRESQAPPNPAAPLSFDTLVREHRGWMFSVARRITRDSTLAEDCVQDALLCAYRRLDSFEGRSTLKSWLHRIVVNASLMKLRSRKRHEERCSAPLPDDDSAGRDVTSIWEEPNAQCPVQTLSRRQTAAMVRHMVEALPESYRAIIRYRDFLEHSTAEAAEILNISEGAAKIRLHRARAALKRLLADRVEEIWVN